MVCFMKATLGFEAEMIREGIDSAFHHVNAPSDAQSQLHHNWEKLNLRRWMISDELNGVSVDIIPKSIPQELNMLFATLWHN